MQPATESTLSTIFQVLQHEFMAKGKAIPESTQWIVIRLATCMPVDEIAMYTDIGVRSVKRLLAYFNKHGELNIPKQQKPQ